MFLGGRSPSSHHVRWLHALSSQGTQERWEDAGSGDGCECSGPVLLLLEPLHSILAFPFCCCHLSFSVVADTFLLLPLSRQGLGNFSFQSIATKDYDCISAFLLLSKDYSPCRILWKLKVIYVFISRVIELSPFSSKECYPQRFQATSLTPSLLPPPLEVTFMNPREFSNSFITEKRGEPSTFLLRGINTNIYIQVSFGCCPFRLSCALEPVLKLEATCQPKSGFVATPAWFRLSCPLNDTSSRWQLCFIHTVPDPSAFQLKVLILPACVETLGGRIELGDAEPGQGGMGTGEAMSEGRGWEVTEDLKNGKGEDRREVRGTTITWKRWKLSYLRCRVISGWKGSVPESGSFVTFIYLSAGVGGRGWALCILSAKVRRRATDVALK